METTNGMYTERRSEVKEWRVFSLVNTARGRLRQIAGMATSNPQPRAEIRRQRTILRRTVWGSKLERTDMDTDRPAAPDRRALDLAFTQGKEFVSMVTSVAAILGSASVDSGVDWKSASQGLDLILNSSREYTTGYQSADAEYDADFERSTYINGAQHMLRGLPRDLEPGEAAMLHRAMPPALRAASAARTPPPAPGRVGGQHRIATAGGGPGATTNQNMVHVLVLFCLCWLYSFAAWFVPKVARYGARIILAEQKHGYVPRLMVAASRFLHAVVDVLRWLGERWPFQWLEYVRQGVRGAVQEFGEKAVAREGFVGGTTFR
ncbi:hypothetical protein C8A00DRAFT_36089 [Chaetomidium leptoderma]|uniref:Uncharacterized protein n=1 Tax=Chaetomidium leptoderma TaxID=669021 RepID=A0AAN6VGX2_9PEZI|nr:hypothetical protein C8A00DRAFT_36089 [Chaetomidium leptoderma]